MESNWVLMRNTIMLKQMFNREQISFSIAFERYIIFFYRFKVRRISLCPFFNTGVIRALFSMSGKLPFERISLAMLAMGVANP